MNFKDRAQAAAELSKVLNKGEGFSAKDLVVVSLLRGGVIIGNVLAKKLKVKHLGLVVTKISAPFNEEFALGALTFDVTYLEKEAVDELKLSTKEVSAQIVKAERKFAQKALEFDLKETDFEVLRAKNVLLVDDGIATGASAKAAALFSKSKGAKSISLAVPVAPTSIDFKGFDNTYILHQDPNFKAVSQYYDYFPQIEDEEVKKLLS